MPSRHDEDEHQRDVRVVAEQDAGGVGRDAEHRPDREVDVAGDDHDRLADREERDDRRTREQLLHARGAEEVGVVDGRRADDEDEGEDDPELAEAQ